MVNNMRKYKVTGYAVSVFFGEDLRNSVVIEAEDEDDAKKVYEKNYLRELKEDLESIFFDDIDEDLMDDDIDEDDPQYEEEFESRKEIRYEITVEPLTEEAEGQLKLDL